MESLQGAAKKLKSLGVTVYGMSRDSVNDQAAFAKKSKLKMPLLSDPDGSATEKYDAAMDGRAFSERITFVIDPKGIIRVRDDDVNVKSHGADLFKRIGELQND